MKCPACQSQFVRTIANDHHCSNDNCPVYTKLWHKPYVLVKPGWWFAGQYKLVYNRDDAWYNIQGPLSFTGVEGYRSVLYRIDNISYTSLSGYRKSYYGNVYMFDIPYMALPVNEDFDREFQVLLSKFDRWFDKLRLLG